MRNPEHFCSGFFVVFSRCLAENLAVSSEFLSREASGINPRLPPIRLRSGQASCFLAVTLGEVSEVRFILDLHNFLMKI